MVSLRHLTIRDAEQIASLLNNKHVWNNLRDLIPMPYSVDDARSFIQMAHNLTPQENQAIIFQDTLVGVCGVHPQKDVYRLTAEIGFWIGEPYWNKGIATKAIELLIKYTQDHFNLTRLEAQVYETNPGSQRVLEKNGFICEGRLKKKAVKNEQVLDVFLYALVR